MHFAEEFNVQEKRITKKKCTRYFLFRYRSKSLRVSSKKRKPTDLTRHGGKAMRNEGSKTTAPLIHLSFNANLFNL
jgi:hypothetical protein